MGSLKWQLSKKVFLAQLEHRRAVVQYLLALIALYGRSASPDMITVGLRNYLEWMEAMFEEAGRIKMLEEESKETERKIFEIQQGTKRNRRKRLRKQLVKQKQVDKELDVLEKSDTGRFVKSLQGVVRDLLYKSQRVFRYRDAYIGLGAHVRRIKEIKLAIASEYIEKTEFTPFGILLILKADYYREIDTHPEPTRGKHFGGTPFSLISGITKDRSEEDVRGTVWHEEKHNLLDGVPNIHKGGVSLAKVEDGIAMWSVKYLKAKDLLDNLHEEIIAASEQAERAWKSGDVDDFTALRTAGGEMSKMLMRLTEARKKARDKEWILALSRAEGNVEREFYLLTRHMRVSLGVAREIGEEATKGVHILFVLLRPSKYRHILSYLKYKYGEEKVGKIMKKIRII